MPEGADIPVHSKPIDTDEGGSSSPSSVLQHKISQARRSIKEAMDEDVTIAQIMANSSRKTWQRTLSRFYTPVKLAMHERTQDAISRFRAFNAFLCFWFRMEQ